MGDKQIGCRISLFTMHILDRELMEFVRLTLPFNIYWQRESGKGTYQELAFVRSITLWVPSNIYALVESKPFPTVVASGPLSDMSRSTKLGSSINRAESDACIRHKVPELCWDRTTRITLLPNEDSEPNQKFDVRFDLRSSLMWRGSQRPLCPGPRFVKALEW